MLFRQKFEIFCNGAVNLAYKLNIHTSLNTMSPEQANIDHGFKSKFVIFFGFFRNVFEFVDKAQFQVHTSGVPRM